MSDPRWLDDDEQRVWRRWLAVNAGLQRELHRELNDDAGLSLADFDVLVALTDVPDARLRVAALARAVGWERSRLSHHVARMGRRGLVERDDCADDGRGAFVVLTAAGRSAIEQAAPGHVAVVRRLVFDHLDADDLRALDAVLTRVDAALPVR